MSEKLDNLRENMTEIVKKKLDLNKDGKVDLKDLGTLVFDTLDLNNDGKVDLLDASIAFRALSSACLEKRLIK